MHKSTLARIACYSHAGMDCLLFCVPMSDLVKAAEQLPALEYSKCCGVGCQLHAVISLPWRPQILHTIHTLYCVLQLKCKPARSGTRNHLSHKRCGHAVLVYSSTPSAKVGHQFLSRFVLIQFVARITATDGGVCTNTSPDVVKDCLSARSKQWFCPRCPFGYPTPERLLVHLMAQHKELQPSFQLLAHPSAKDGQKLIQEVMTKMACAWWVCWTNYSHVR